MPALLLAACASESRGYFVGESAPAPEQVRRVLVVPLNFDATPPAYLVRGTEILQAEVLAHLRRTDREVARARLADVLRIWKRLASETGGFTEEDGAKLRKERVEAARSRLVQELVAAYSADVVVMPTLVVRDGWYVDFFLRWDGVLRTVPIDADFEGMRIEGHSLRGKGQGTSLRMTLYTPDGQKYFERYAGLEPIARFTVGGFGTAQGARMQEYRRTDLFQDREILRDGIALSLTPALEPPVAATE